MNIGLLFVLGLAGRCVAFAAFGLTNRDKMGLPSLYHEVAPSRWICLKCAGYMKTFYIMLSSFTVLSRPSWAFLQQKRCHAADFARWLEGEAFLCRPLRLLEKTGEQERRRKQQQSKQGDREQWQGKSEWRRGRWGRRRETQRGRSEPRRGRRGRRVGPRG